MKKIKTIYIYIYIYIYKCLDSKIENSIPKAIPSIPNTQNLVYIPFSLAVETA